MGLLDDAIREHLELKRRHGADPSEVARQEREALGHATAAEPAPEEPPLAEPVALAAPEPDLDWSEPAVEEVPAEDEPEDVLEETPEFLEETPEHDRLWFEQRPPKDFDF